MNTPDSTKDIIAAIQQLNTDTVNAVNAIILKSSYALNFHTNQFNPVDNTVYALGADDDNFGTVFGTIQRIAIPKSGTIKAALAFWFATVAGTNENITMSIRLNNTTDTTIATVGTAAQSKTFSNFALNIAVAAGDFIEIKLTCPTWVTNPTSVNINYTLYIE